jgi:hypothetical protein
LIFNETNPWYKTAMNFRHVDFFFIFIFIDGIRNWKIDITLNLIFPTKIIDVKSRLKIPTSKELRKKNQKFESYFLRNISSLTMFLEAIQNS